MTHSIPCQGPQYIPWHVSLAGKYHLGVAVKIFLITVITVICFHDHTIIGP
jgi:hypothetical protein